MKPTSIDLRERILATYDEGGCTQQEVADRYRVSRELVKKLLRQRRETGCIAPLPLPGAPRKIKAEHEKHLLELIDESPDMTLEELRDAIGVDCTPQAVHYALRRMGVSLERFKVKRVLFAEGEGGAGRPDTLPDEVRPRAAQTPRDESYHLSSVLFVDMSQFKPL